MKDKKKIRIFIDTEFIEKQGSLDLISIGLVSEEGEEFYAISSDFNENEASNWVKDNVISKLDSNIKRQSNKQIALDILDFLSDCGVEFEYETVGHTWDHIEDQSDENINLLDATYFSKVKQNIEIEWWAYYSSYDWVIFCWLFGSMLTVGDMGLGMRCNDIKQLEADSDLLESTRIDIDDLYIDKPPHNALEDARWCKQIYLHILHGTKPV